MNATGHINIEFKGSNLQGTILHASVEGLQRLLSASKYAVEYWTENGDQEQGQFFQEAVALCKRRLNKKRTNAN